MSCVLSTPTSMLHTFHTKLINKNPTPTPAPLPISSNTTATILLFFLLPSTTPPLHAPVLLHPFLPPPLTNSNPTPASEEDTPFPSPFERASMAVETHHLRLFPSQLLPNSRDFIASSIANKQVAGLLSPAMPTSGVNNSNIPAVAAVTADAAESTLTSNDHLFNLKSKRSRSDEGAANHLNAAACSPFDHGQLEITHLINCHTEKVRAELWEKRRQFLRQAAAAAEVAVAQRLKAREQEIERLSRVNSALQDRVRSLSIESQLWRDLARSNEAAAAALRTNLERALSQQQEQERCCGDRGEEDAESCCDDNDVGERGDGAAAGMDGADEKRRRVACRVCGDGEPCVLLLPCRHLCLCSPCAAAAQACPVCCCAKQCTVHVNFS